MRDVIEKPACFDGRRSIKKKIANMLMLGRGLCSSVKIRL